MPSDPDSAVLVREEQSPPTTPSAPQGESATACSSSSPLSAAARLAKRKRCHVCPKRKDRKTSLSCFICSKPLCPEHSNRVTFCNPCIILEELGQSVVKAHIVRGAHMPSDPESAALVREDEQSPPSTPSAPQGESATASSSSSPGSAATRMSTTPCKPPESKRRRCQVCPSRKDRKTSLSCFVCSKPLCPEHSNRVTYCNTCI
ncbi:uncharacterized protein LOC134436524 [Engraulis encrasicolus]|uniref:uncharacterized protein LOC134436524 n=1 Tax=Engraulis encrasicolus TaxID=184585 RepID=UPI002FD41BD0